MRRVRAHISLVIVVVWLSVIGCGSSKRTVLYTDSAGKWKLALLPDSNYLLRAVEDFPSEYYAYGRYSIQGNDLRLTSAVPDVVKVNVSEHGSGTTGPRIIHVVDCKGDPLDWRQVTMYLDTVQLLGSGSVYRLPVKPTPSSKLLVRSPPHSISFETVDMGQFKADTLTCQVGLPGMLLYPTRPLVITPQTSTLRITTGGLVFGSVPLHVVNGPAFPTVWRVITNKREKRTLLLHMPSRTGHTCP